MQSKRSFLSTSNAAESKDRGGDNVGEKKESERGGFHFHSWRLRIVLQCVGVDKNAELRLTRLFSTLVCASIWSSQLGPTLVR